MAVGSAKFDQSGTMNIRPANSLEVIATGPYSAHVWYKHDGNAAAASSGCFAVATSGIAEGGTDGGIFYTSNTGTANEPLFVSGLTGSATYDYNGAAAADTWHWLCATRDKSEDSGGVYKVYLDGALVTHVFSGTHGVDDFSAGVKRPAIGTINGSGSSFQIVGKVTQAVVWAVELTAEQIAYIWQNRFSIAGMMNYVGETPLMAIPLDGRDENGSVIVGKVITDDDLGLVGVGSNDGGTTLVNGSPTWSADSPFPDTGSRVNRTGRLLRPHLYRPEYYRPRQTILVEDEG